MGQINDKLSVIGGLLGGTAKHYVDQYVVLFHYSSLGGYTAMPGGLHARLCHAFLVSCFIMTCRVFPAACTNSDGSAPGIECGSLVA